MPVRTLRSIIRRCHHWTATVGALALADCSQANAPMSAISVTDSAGIRIIAFEPATVDVPEAAFVSSRGALAAGLDTLDIGRLGGVATTRDREGRISIAIGDASGAAVLMLNSTGTVTDRFGRHGQGPGEFADVRVVGVTAAGEIVVHDFLRKRFGWFDASGTATAGFEVAGTGWGTAIPVAVSRDGSTIVATHTKLPDPVAKGTVRARVYLRRVNHPRTGGSRDLGEFLGDAFVWKTGGPDGLTMGEAPYGARLLVTSFDDAVTIAGADDHTLRILDANGRMRAQVRLNGEAIRVTDKAIAAYRSSVAPRAKGREAEWAVLTSDDVFPATMPRVAALLTDLEGQRWIFLQHDITDRQATAIVLDTMDLPILRASMPASVRPLAMLDELLIGITTSDDGVERLTVLELRRR